MDERLLQAILATIRTRESGGNYQARNPNGSASGAYQFINDTWRALGGARYAPTAAQATKAQQDEIARRHVESIVQRYGSYEAVPVVWYVGHVPSNLDYVPRGGNRLTVGQYQQEWLGQLQQQMGGQAPPKPTQQTGDRLGAVRRQVINAAFSALGIMYQWGGNSLATGVDCSGLIQQAYKAAGIDLPRVSAQQARHGGNIGLKDLKPGDLVSWDNASRNVGADHVAMFIGYKNGVPYVIEAPGRGRQIRTAQMKTQGATYTRVIGDSKTGDQSFWERMASQQATQRAGNAWGNSKQSYNPDEWGASELIEIDAGFQSAVDEVSSLQGPVSMSPTAVMPWWRTPIGERNLPERSLS